MESRYASQPAIHPFRRPFSWSPREPPRSTVRIAWPPQIRDAQYSRGIWRKKKKMPPLFSSLDPLTSSRLAVRPPSLPLNASAGKWACECCESRRNAHTLITFLRGFWSAACRSPPPPVVLRSQLRGTFAKKSFFSPSDLSNKWLVESVLWLAE